jgi:hypothetical protein
VVSTTTVALAFVLIGFCSLASGRDGIPGSVRVQGITISCYHNEVHRFTAEVKPARSEGSYGVNVRNGIRVRVIAFRRVRCTDGRTFYSATSVVEPGNGSYSVIRLPTCGIEADPPRRPHGPGCPAVGQQAGEDEGASRLTLFRRGDRRASGRIGFVRA